MDAFDQVRNMDIQHVADPPPSAHHYEPSSYHQNHIHSSEYIQNNTTIHNMDYPQHNAVEPFQSPAENLDLKQHDLDHQKSYNENDVEVERLEPEDTSENLPIVEERLEETDNKNVSKEIVENEKEEEKIDEKITNGVVTEVDTEEQENIVPADVKPDIVVEKINENAESEPPTKSIRLKLKIKNNLKEEINDEDDEDLPIARRGSNRKTTVASTAASNSAASVKTESPAPVTTKKSRATPTNKTKEVKEKKEPKEAAGAIDRKGEVIDEEQCRVCLVKDDLVSIFKTDNKQSIADKLMTVCNGIRIQRKDFLPQFICNTCMQSVQVAYNLKILCETTEKDLRSKLSRSKKKMRRPATEYVLLDATKFPSDDSDGEAEDDDEFKLSNEEEIAKSSSGGASDSGSNYGGKRRSRRVRSKKPPPKSRRRTATVAATTPSATPARTKSKPTAKATPTSAAKSTPASAAKSNATGNSISKRTRKESSSPDKRATADFSSGSEDNYAPPQRKTRKPEKKTNGTPPSNAPKEAPCPYCNEMFPSQSALMKHKKTHANQPLNCDMCGKTFKLLAAYQAHIDKHKTDGDSLTCTKCEKTFTKLVERKRHLIEVHNEKPETFPCEKCKRVFALKKTLEKHIEENKCPGPKPVKPVVTPPQKKVKSEMENLTLGRDLFKCVAPVTTTYWSDSFSD